jgi:energy-coupling factor transport system ATP-binding protein
LQTIKRLRDDHGVTVVLITHHMDEAINADRVVVLLDGHVSLDGTPREVFKDISKLREAGVTVPDTVMLMHRLKSDGYNVNLDALTVEECASSIFDAWKEQSARCVAAEVTA